LTDSLLCYVQMQCFSRISAENASSQLYFSRIFCLSW